MSGLLALILAALLAPGEMPEFRVVDLGPLGRVTQRSYADLDGDGRTEIVLGKGRRLFVFRPDGKGGYDVGSPVVIVPEDDALFYEIAQIDRDEETLEIALVTPRGLVSYAVDDGKLATKPRVLLPAESLVQRGQEDDLHWRGFLRDLSGDGLADVVLPTSRGFAVYYQGRDKAGPGVWSRNPDRLVPYTVISSLDIGAPGLSGRLRGRTEVPDFHVLDFNGDGRTDFVVDDGKSLRIFAAGEDGRLGEDPPKTVDLAPLTGASGTLPPFELRDVNGDGLPDYVLSRQ
ncbi:MAG: FG-GAP repeat domain-containing protein, partial [Planctomycetota bacterium]